MKQFQVQNFKFPEFFRNVNDDIASTINKDDNGKDEDDEEDYDLLALTANHWPMLDFTKYLSVLG